MQPLWQPSSEQIQSTNMKAFMDAAYIADYPALYQWSIDHPEEFWCLIWQFCGVIAEQRGQRVIENPHDMEKARFFPDARLNYAQNLLRRRDNALAIEFFGESQVHTTLTYAELYDQVSRWVRILQDWGVRPGDRVAAYMPNMPETLVAMLATASLGAIWSSCSPDFGVSGVVDRFGQIAPKVLFVCDGYYYNGKHFECVSRIAPIREAVPSIEKVVIVGYHGEAPLVPSTTRWESMAEVEPEEIHFAQLPFNHPLFILYSSGTTGVPKCIVHGAGGTLLQHLKEHQLHCDIKHNDRVFYFTTCGWMMWNWLVSALASQARLILYDGSPVFPNPERLFDIADQTQMTHFGTSAKYIDSIAKMSLKPKKTHQLKDLRVMASTGSPLGPESFDYVYESIKENLCLASISGGTDIISCFMLGNPMGPVWRGELQTAGLGMKVEVYDEEGNALVGEKGELVCTAPFPCQPVSFWNDADAKKYHNAYFAKFKNIWHHGDFVEKTVHGGFIVHGRSDAVLNPGGIRIGTAEIYRQVEKLDEVLESLVVGHDVDGDVQVILFVKLRPELQLTDALVDKIKKQIRTNTTPRHVPHVILQVSDIPRTKNGKIAEIAVRETIHGRPVKNVEALANPEILESYRQLAL